METIIERIQTNGMSEEEMVQREEYLLRQVDNVVVKLRDGRCSKSDIVDIAKRVEFEARMGHLTPLATIDMFVKVKYMETLLKGLEDALKETATEMVEASMERDVDGKNAGAMEWQRMGSLQIRKSAPVYDYDDAEWEQLKTDQMELELEKLDLKAKEHELKLRSQLLSEKLDRTGCKKTLVTEEKKTIVVTLK